MRAINKTYYFYCGRLPHCFNIIILSTRYRALVSSIRIIAYFPKTQERLKGEGQLDNALIVTLASPADVMCAGSIEYMTILHEYGLNILFTLCAQVLLCLMYMFAYKNNKYFRFSRIVCPVSSAVVEF